MAKDNTNLILVIVGILAAVYFLGPTLCSDFDICIMQEQQPAPATPAEPGVTALGCIHDGATMTVGPMQERWNPTTDVSGKAAKVFVNGVDRGVKVDSATLDVDYDDLIDIYYAENASAAQYYTNHESFRVPCDSSFASAEFGDGELLVSIDAGTLNFKVFQDDDGLLNAVGATEAITSGEVVQLPIHFHPNYEDGWSPNCPGVVVLEGNSTVFEHLEIVGYALAPTPRQWTASNTSVASWAYYVPSFVPTASGSYDERVESLLIKATSVDPATDIITSWYDCDWFPNTNTGVMEQGVEDNDNSDVGMATITQVVWIG